MQFVDLAAQYAVYKDAIDTGIAGVLAHGRFIMGPEVAELEEALASFTGAKHAIGCSSGTDALMMTMIAEGIGLGDAIFLPTFTFTAAAEVPLLLGATPVFVDVNRDDFNMDLDDLARRIEATKAAGKVTPKGILATDLFGLPADYDALHDLAKTCGLTVWSDAAQSMGGQYKSKRVGALSRATATSFFPAKPLGCYGDGGAVFTDDCEMAAVMRSIRAHGKGTEKYDIQRVGLNARLDTIQAAVLLAKLPHLSDEIAARENVAKAYDQQLSKAVKLPGRRDGVRSAWAQYTLRLPAEKRDRVVAKLSEAGIPSAVYYPAPMHLQTAYRSFGDGEGSLPVSEALCSEVLSLPMHPFLKENQIAKICDTLNAAMN
jgi:dTDP-4-amino-4,6-dideoxygalactose transaminase